MEIRNGCKPIFFVCMVFTMVFVFGYMPLLHRDSAARSTPCSKIPQNPLMIITNKGRLGNQMFLFATLYGLGRLNYREIALTPNNFQVLSKYFDLGNYSVIDENHFTRQIPWVIRNWLQREDYSIPLTANIISGTKYPTSYTFFHNFRNEITEIFRFDDNIRGKAQEVLRHVKAVRPWTEVFIGVHVRRGDFISTNDGSWLKDFEGREVDSEFFHKAVNHFRSKYHNITFLAVSDDRKWCREHLSQFGILTTPETESAAQDLALLVECNHTIMSYGTYGFWGGYLAGGEVVYFTDFLKPNTSFTRTYYRYEKMYPPDWVGLSTTRPGYWDNYSNPFSS